MNQQPINRQRGFTLVRFPNDFKAGIAIDGMTQPLSK